MKGRTVTADACTQRGTVASENVGKDGLRRSTKGAPSRRATLRLANAASLASASMTSSKLPRPMVRLLPCTTMRCTQLFAPLGVIASISPCP